MTPGRPVKDYYYYGSGPPCPHFPPAHHRRIWLLLSFLGRLFPPRSSYERFDRTESARLPSSRRTSVEVSHSFRVEEFKGRRVRGEKSPIASAGRLRCGKQEDGPSREGRRCDPVVKPPTHCVPEIAALFFFSVVFFFLFVLFFIEECPKVLVRSADDPAEMPQGIYPGPLVQPTSGPDPR